ncbi:MAG: cytochrome bc complex cytochrome b subunit [Solirubrobacterales bacterium]
MRRGVLRSIVRATDERTGAVPFVRKALRYVFPDQWSFLLGEVALYSFVVLVGTGIYLTLFYDPSTAKTVYHGSYDILRGQEVTASYNSVLRISFDVKAGLLIRQTHHWAADIFVAAIVLHLIRVFFTGAYRKPRELTYLIGVLMLFLALLEGYLGYSLVDDLLSGMGLAIGYSVALSIPFIGANLALLIWGGPFPGEPEFWSRMYIAHVLILPVIIGTLIGLHLALVASRHHTQFPGKPPRSERRLVGLPTFPGYAPRSLALFFSVAGVLFLLGGLVQINPIWLWGPYHVGQGTNGAQPDWYLGWLIGALRLVPHFDVVIANRTVVPNPFWGGALFPLIVLGALLSWPWLERRATGDYAVHNLLERPRDRPWRTAIGVAFLTWVILIFMFGSADRAYVLLGLSYQFQLWAYRVMVFVLPVIVLFATRWICLNLKSIEEREEDREEAEEEAAEAARTRALATVPGGESR